MDIINHLVLAWLEEDNQKLGHFRARPLLRETGPFTPAEIGELRDDGYIRINLACPPALFDKGLSRLVSGLKRLMK